MATDMRRSELPPPCKCISSNASIRWCDMDSLTATIIDYRYFIELMAIAIAIVTAVSSIDDVLVDLFYWCLKLFGRQDSKDRKIARQASETAQSSERPFA